VKERGLNTKMKNDENEKEGSDKWARRKVKKKVTLTVTRELLYMKEIRSRIGDRRCK